MTLRGIEEPGEPVRSSTRRRSPLRPLRDGAAISYDTGPVTLNSRYALTWYDFSSPAGHPDGTEFKYLILEPEMSGTPSLVASR